MVPDGDFPGEVILAKHSPISGDLDGFHRRSWVGSAQVKCPENAAVEVGDNEQFVRNLDSLSSAHGSPDS